MEEIKLTTKQQEALKRLELEQSKQEIFREFQEESEKLQTNQKKLDELRMEEFKLTTTQQEALKRLELESQKADDAEKSCQAEEQKLETLKKRS